LHGGRGGKQERLAKQVQPDPLDHITVARRAERGVPHPLQGFERQIGDQPVAHGKDRTVGEAAHQVALGPPRDTRQPAHCKEVAGKVRAFRYAAQGAVGVASPGGADIDEFDRVPGRQRKQFRPDPKAVGDVRVSRTAQRGGGMFASCFQHQNSGWMSSQSAAVSSRSMKSGLCSNGSPWQNTVNCPDPGPCAIMWVR
jgi:hypothetical protein